MSDEDSIDNKEIFDEAFLYFLSKLYRDFPVRVDLRTLPSELSEIEAELPVSSEGATRFEGHLHLPDSDDRRTQEERRAALAARCESLPTKSLIWRETFDWLVSCGFVSVDDRSEATMKLVLRFVSEDGEYYKELSYPSFYCKCFDVKGARLTPEGFSVLRAKAPKDEENSFGDMAVAFSKSVAHDVGQSAKRTLVSEIVAYGTMGVKSLWFL
jgi:hypothetical protein